MKDFIERKMNEIFEDFKGELNNLHTCCVLKNIRYDGGNIPDYSQNIVQQLYLLRYSAAYLIEYYAIFKRLIDMNFLDEYNVLSIGSGCGLDYYGLHFALSEISQELVNNICYTGIDVINWNYKEDIDNDFIYFLNEDITKWDELDWDEYNIIMFPKSIGEFSNEGYNKLLEVFRNSTFKNDRICLVSSVREKNEDIDVDRLNDLIKILKKEQNYSCLDDNIRYSCYKENVGLAKYYSQFKYPDEILKYITNLLDRCPKYIENWFEACDENCATLLNKYPILKTGHIKYQIKRLER